MVVVKLDFGPIGSSLARCHKTEVVLNSLARQFPFLFAVTLSKQIVFRTPCKWIV